MTARLSTLCITAALTSFAPASFGNDLVDFLRAVNAPRHHHHHHVHHPRRAGRHLRHHRIHRHGIQPYRRSVSIHIGRTTPTRFDHPQPVLYPPAPSTFGALPHELGEVVTCDVPLAAHVRVRNADEIAPGAYPIVVAVRSPHLAPWGSPGCVESLAYVQVFAPPIPLRELSVSPCRTRIVLDYGKWEIRIRSRDGLIEVEYDD